MSAVEVYGRSLISSALWSGDDASRVVVRDPRGQPILLIVKMNDHYWGVCSAADRNWKDELKANGIDVPDSAHPHSEIGVAQSGNMG